MRRGAARDDSQSPTLWRALGGYSITLDFFLRDEPVASYLHCLQLAAVNLRAKGVVSDTKPSARFM